jgi:hypothetical protein
MASAAGSGSMWRGEQRGRVGVLVAAVGRDDVDAGTGGEVVADPGGAAARLEEPRGVGGWLGGLDLGGEQAAGGVPGGVDRRVDDPSVAGCLGQAERFLLVAGQDRDGPARVPVAADSDQHRAGRRVRGDVGAADGGDVAGVEAGAQAEDELGEKGAGAGLAGLVGRPEQQRVDLGRRTGLDAVAGRPAGLGLVEQALAALGDAA